MLILSGVVFFFLVVGFILKQRILDRGLRIALWWTKYVPNFGGDEELMSKMEKGVEGLTNMVKGVTDTTTPAAVTAVASTVAAHVSSASSSVLTENSTASTTRDASSSLSKPLSSVLDSVIGSTTLSERPEVTSSSILRDEL